MPNHNKFHLAIMKCIADFQNYLKFNRITDDAILYLLVDFTHFITNQ